MTNLKKTFWFVLLACSAVFFGLQPAYANTYVLTSEGNPKDGGTINIKCEMAKENIIENVVLLFVDSSYNSVQTIDLTDKANFQNGILTAKYTPKQVSENAALVALGVTAELNGMRYQNCSDWLDLGPASNSSAVKPSTNIVMKVGEPSMQVNGVTMEIDPGRGTKPVIVQGRTLIPIRALIEAIDGYVGWNQKENKVSISIGDNNIEFWVNYKYANVNGKSVELDVPAQVINGRMMIPIRFLAEQLGLSVDWNESKGEIVLGTKQ